MFLYSCRDMRLAAGGFMNRVGRLTRISILVAPPCFMQNTTSPQGNNAFLEQLLQVLLGCECLSFQKYACAFTSDTEMCRNFYYQQVIGAAGKH